MLKRGARVVALEPQAELARELADSYPAATVLPVGVSDHVGEARLTTSTTHKHLATMNPGFSHESFDSATTIPITTLDELIAEFGCPALVKVDTEGHDDKVFAGLSQPIDQVLFEVHSALPTVAAGCFERLAELGQYEYRLTVHRPDGESWVFGPPVTDSAVLAELPDVGDVYARRIR
jgi:FkbM family methyltransferase